MKLAVPVAPGGTWEPLTPLLEAALDDPQAGIMVVDENLKLIHASSRLARFMGVSNELLAAGADVLEIIRRADFDAASISSAEAYLSRADSHDSKQALTLYKDRSSVEVHMGVRHIGPNHRLASFRESASMDSAPNEADSASYDSLTGLCTRAHFEKAVTDGLAQHLDQPVIVLLLDLDRFKAVNDTLGHAAGDTVLRLTAKRLQSAVREVDLVARLGGDEFAVMIHPGLERFDPSEVAKRIVDLIGRTYLVDGQLVNVGCSIGVALGPEHASEYNGLLRCADLALYHSKNRGRGNYQFFSPDMEVRAQARRANEVDLRRALALRQLEVFYQPQVDIETRQLAGFEALLRWRHPKRGLIPPNDFLTIAEETGIIIPIGEWVLRTACREAMNWPDSVVIAVNASPLQFLTGRFAESVRSALDSSGLPGYRLEIEITEGILLGNEEVVMTTLSDLRAMGVRIAMDDFGTGYASLSQLARFPFDRIKIDKSLVGAGGDTAKHRAIVRAISTLGDSLGVSTTAEGIETPEQLARCKSDGCGSVQGYLFSRPVPSSELAALIARLPAPDRQEQTLPSLGACK